MSFPRGNQRCPAWQCRWWSAAGCSGCPFPQTQAGQDASFPTKAHLPPKHGHLTHVPDGQGSTQIPSWTCHMDNNRTAASTWEPRNSCTDPAVHSQASKHTLNISFLAIFCNLTTICKARLSLWSPGIRSHVSSPVWFKHTFFTSPGLKIQPGGQQVSLLTKPVTNHLILS